MATPSKALWATLVSHQLVESDMPEFKTLPTPWYIRVLHGFGGWTAACFLILFLAAGLADILENTIGSLFIAIISIGVAYFLYQNKAESDFYNIFALSLSFVGQGILLFRLIDADLSVSITWGLWALLQIAMVAFIPNYLHRILSSIAAITGLAIVAIDHQLLDLIIAFCASALTFIFLYEYTWHQFRNYLYPIGYALLLTLLSSLIAMVIIGGPNEIGRMLGEAPIQASLVSHYLYEATIAVLFIYTAHHLLKRQSTNKHILIAAYIVAGIFSLLTLEVSGFALSMIVVLLGFNNGNRLMLSLGIASLLFFVSFYYYNLDTTLLIKSLLLIALGAVFLIARYILAKKLPLGDQHA